MVKCWRELLLVAGLAASAFSPAVAQAPAPPPPVVWQLGWQQSHCTISTADSSGVTLSLWMLPGDPDPHLYLFGPSKLVPQPSGTATVKLLPSGETFDVLGDVESRKGPVVVKMMHLWHKFPPAFAQSSEVTVAARGKQVTIAIPGATKAMAALRECVDQRLPAWGVDPRVYDALQVPPTDIESYQFMSADDYPPALLQAGWVGDVIIRMNVDATGKVADCAVLVSSGQKSLDDLACLRSVQRGRYNPAVGADGKPVAAPRVRDVLFRIAY